MRGDSRLRVEYDNRRRVPEVGAISARWQAESAAYRITADAELDLPYGPGERNRYDLFLTGSARAPLVVYVHGGTGRHGLAGDPRCAGRSSPCRHRDQRHLDLQPLVPTSINTALRLDLPTARAASPIFWPPPPKQRAFVAAVGAAESSEFLRQSREIVDQWRRAGVKAEYLEVPIRTTSPSWTS